MEASVPVFVERVTREKAAYDGGSVFKKSSALQARFRHVFFSPGAMRAERCFDRSVAHHAESRDILDYGCYDGWMTPRYLKMKPRSITGLDISETAIAQATASHGDNGKFYAGDAHRMPFPDESFDLVVGRSILHHLDLKLALEEIRRVLRPGGSAIFMEPLGDNPGAKVFRALTPKTRTADEKALTRADIQSADALFGSSSHLFYDLFSVPMAMLTSLTPLPADNIALRLTDIPDRLLARTPLKYWMRAVVLDWRRS
jgi:SAM-dependent methyltransferase